MPHISSVDAQESIIGLDPAIIGSDGVVKNFDNEDARFGTASTDPDSKMFARLTLQGDFKHVFVGSKSWVVRAARSSVLFYSFSIHTKS